MKNDDKQHQGEPVALPERRDINQADEFKRGIAHGFNACLVEITKLGPLYTHADPSEVRVTKQALESLKGEANDLRAQLAERDALLDRVVDHAEVGRLREDLRLVTLARDAFDKRASDLQRRAENADLALRVQTQNCGELRADVETMRRKNNEYWHETETLRAQLAERDVLLIRVLEHLRAGKPGEAQVAIYSAVSVSAESERKS